MAWSGRWAKDLRRRLEVALPRGVEEPLLQLHTVQPNG